MSEMQRSTSRTNAKAKKKVSSPKRFYPGGIPPELWPNSPFQCPQEMLLNAPGPGKVNLTNYFGMINFLVDCGLAAQEAAQKVKRKKGGRELATGFHFMSLAYEDAAATLLRLRVQSLYDGWAG